MEIGLKNINLGDQFTSEKRENLIFYFKKTVQKNTYSKLIDKLLAEKDIIPYSFENYQITFNTFTIHELSMDNCPKIYLDNNKKYEYFLEYQPIFEKYNFIETLEKYYKELLIIEDRYNSLLKNNDIDTIPINNSFLKMIQKNKSYLDNLLNFSKEFFANFQSELAKTKKGYEGEERVNRELSLFDDRLINIPNLRIEQDGISAENDNFIISPFGLFSIEVKNYGSTGSYSVKITKDGRWTKVLKNGVEERLDNVTSQATRHIALTQKLINKALKELGYDIYLPVSFIIVMANEAVDIENQSNIPIIRTSNLYYEISRRGEILDDNIIKEIHDILTKNSLPLIGYPTACLDTVTSTLKNACLEAEDTIPKIKKMLEAVYEIIQEII